MTTIHYSVSEGLCLLRLDGPPVNVITLASLEELVSSIRRAARDGDVQSIVITGRADHFSAGADVGLFRDIDGPGQAARISRLFQEAFAEVEDSPKPVAAAVAGKVIGGALELAMACHFRVCDRRSLFSMPEVNLGINPGAGGTQRLPRLVGVEAALKMLLTGEPVDAARALAMGLVDAVCDGDDLLACAARLLRSAAAGAPRRTRDRLEKVTDDAANQAAFDQARARLAGDRPELIAPPLILEAARTGLAESFEAGLRSEQEAFARCMDSLATRNKIYVFFATRETAKSWHPQACCSLGGGASHGHPPTADTPKQTTLGGATKEIRISRVAVIGMGSMGTGIAQAVMMAGLSVTVLDERPAAVHSGKDRILASLQKRLSQGKLTPQRLEATMALLSPATDWPGIAQADLVIEAVFEDVAVKRSVLAAAERVVGAEAILASNTSTISLDVLADGLRRPERLVGLHFFNPAHAMPLVEVIRRDASAPEVVASAMKFAKTLRKTPVLVRNREGFLVNRLFIPYFKEAFWLLEDGAQAQEIDRAMCEFGFPMGPLTLIDMAGIDILVHTDAVLRGAFPRHGPLPAVAAALADRGLVGQKSGGGVYRYEKGRHAPLPSPACREVVAQVRQGQGKPPRAIEPDEIVRRLVLRMVAEAFYVLEEGLVQRESDVDAAMVLGTGFPDFRGGVVKYARDLGLPAVLGQLAALAGQLGERFAPCKLLRDMARTGEK